MKVPIENVVDLMLNDVYVDVDIHIKPLTYSNDPTRAAALANINGQLGCLAQNIKQLVKDEIRKFFEEHTTDE